MGSDSVTDFDRMLEELKQEIAERERAIYSDVVREEASAPKNVGRMADADLEGVVHGWCGDTMEVYLRLNNESTTIDEATFATDGCGATVACGSILTQIITGMKLEKAEWLLPEDLLKALGGLPEEHVHCADLAISTLQNALFNWRMLRTQDEKEEDETG